MNALLMTAFLFVCVFNFFVADTLKETTDTKGRLLFIANMVAGAMNLASAIWYMVK